MEVAPAPPLVRLLAVPDLLQAVAAFIDREQAGRVLAPACRAAAAVVRAEDAKTAALDDDPSSQHEGRAPREIWRPCPPAWNLQRVQARIARRYADSGPAGAPAGAHAAPGIELVLKAFATQLDMLRAAGCVAHHFDRARGRPAALVGCHELRVLDPAVFLHAMQQWTECTQRRAYASASCRLFASRAGEEASRAGAHDDPSFDDPSFDDPSFDDPSFDDPSFDDPSFYVLSLLAALGLRPRGGPGSRFPPQAGVARAEVLWQRAYVAIAHDGA
jgi:hypothetical protein